MECPYCNQTLKIHLIIKKDHNNDPVTDREDCNSEMGN